MSNSNSYNNNNNNFSNFQSEFGLYSQDADNLVEVVMQQAIRERWRWPQVYYYMVDELEELIPEIGDSAARSSIFGVFSYRGGEGDYEDYFENNSMWINGSYRNHMTEPLSENSNATSNMSGPLGENSNATPNMPRPIPADTNNIFIQTMSRLLALPPSQERNNAIQSLRTILQLLPQNRPLGQNQLQSMQSNNYTGSLQGIYHDPIPRNTTNIIMGDEIEEGENMVNFHGESNLGRYYKKSTFNAIPTPKKNPFTRKLIEAKNIIPYRARLVGGKRRNRRRTRRNARCC